MAFHLPEYRFGTDTDSANFLKSDTRRKIAHYMPRDGHENLKRQAD